MMTPKFTLMSFKLEYLTDMYHSILTPSWSKYSCHLCLKEVSLVLYKYSHSVSSHHMLVIVLDNAF